MIKRIGIFLTVCLAAALDIQAQELPTLGLDAKSMAMGGVTTTTLSASHAIYNNAVCAPLSPTQAQLSASYLMLEEYNCYTASGFYTFALRNSLLAGWRQFRHAPGNNDMMVDLGYARRIGETWSVGLVARYAHYRRPTGGSDALAADLSVLYLLPLEEVGYYSNLRFGAKVTNLGSWVNSPLKGDLLPIGCSIGAAFDTFITDAHEITVAADLGGYFNPAYARSFQASVGAEYNLMQLVQFRCGYHYGGGADYAPSYGSFGAGVRFLHLRLDFAYLVAEKGSWAHNACNISFGFNF